MKTLASTFAARRVMHVLSFSLLMLSTSCQFAPKYERPNVDKVMPAQWKWKPLQPSDQQFKGEWWSVFNDAELNRLQQLAVQNNYTLQMAVARVDQARAIYGASSVALAPTLTVGGLAKREQTSANMPTPIPVDIPSARYNTFNIPIQLAYEVDLWGRVRNMVRSAKYDADSLQADYQNVLLTLTSNVASQYLLIGSYDHELATLQAMYRSREQSIDLLKQRYESGIVSEADYARAQSELAMSRADLADTKRQREEALHALALLCGQSLEGFQVPAKVRLPNAAKIPVGLPSSLLERRPDVAVAERQLMARNADIGVEVAGYFPQVSLTGDYGRLSKETQSLFTADSKVWSFGPSVSIPVTNLFVTKAKVAAATRKRDEALLQYRQSVLNAVMDVETALAQIELRKQQAAAVQQAADQATRATQLIRQQYTSGSIGYLELLDAERTQLNVQRQVAQVKAQHLLAQIRLIKALGGAW